MGGSSGFLFQNLHTYVAVGTGSTAPANNQTALVAELAVPTARIDVLGG